MPFSKECGSVSSSRGSNLSWGKYKTNTYIIIMRERGKKVEEKSNLKVIEMAEVKGEEEDIRRMETASSNKVEILYLWCREKLAIGP